MPEFFICMAAVNRYVFFFNSKCVTNIKSPEKTCCLTKNSHIDPSIKAIKDIENFLATKKMTKAYRQDYNSGGAHFFQV